MAMSVTIIEKNLGSVKKITFVWVSAADGTATGTTTGVEYDGKIISLTTIPGAVALAPTDNYGITITDSDGHDVLVGAGAARDTALTEHVAEASLGAVAHSRLKLNVSAAGDSKGGTAILYLR